MPFVETGEFANVGIVIFAPDARYFGFKLLIERQSLITNFFEQMEPKVFKAAMRTFREELDRIDRMLKHMERKPVLADDAAAKLQELYAYYVERNFVTREYQEATLDKGVRGWLKSAGLLSRFHPARVGNDEYHAQFPFVAGPDGAPEKAIKPLFLGQPESSRIIDHGLQWVGRINALKKRRLLPRDVLFALEGPDDDTARGHAKRETMADLEATGVIVTSYSNSQAVIDFARP